MRTPEIRKDKKIARDSEGVTGALGPQNQFLTKRGPKSLTSAIEVGWQLSKPSYWHNLYKCFWIGRVLWRGCHG